MGFFEGAKLKKVSVSGGATLVLGDAAFPRGASWGSQGTIIFAPSGDSLILQVADAGGPSQPITRLEKGDISQRWPEFLPDGKAVLFAAGTVAANSPDEHVAVQAVGAGPRLNLTQGGTYPKYPPSGHVVYIQKGTLMASLFDARRLEVTGVAVPVVESVLQSPISGSAQYSFFQHGITGLCSRRDPGGPTQIGVGQSGWVGGAIGGPRPCVPGAATFA